MSENKCTKAMTCYIIVQHFPAVCINNFLFSVVCSRRLACKHRQISGFCFVKMVQWWEHSPSTNLSQVRFPDPALNLLLVLYSKWLFFGYSGFPFFSKTKISKFLECMGIFEQVLVNFLVLRGQTNYIVTYI